ncbi:hypothetical protein [Mesorhizobium sp. A556]
MGDRFDSLESEASSYQSNCMGSALDCYEDYAILSEMRDGKLHAFYGKDSIDRVESLAAAGWIVTGLSPKGLTRYRLADAFMAEMEVMRGRFIDIVVDASAVVGMQPAPFWKEYFRLERGDALGSWGHFHKVFERLSQMPELYRSMGHSTRDRPKNRDQKRLISRGLVAVHEFCGNPYLSVTGALLALRLQAMTETEAILTERRLKAAVTRERNLANRTGNFARPSLWFNVLPEWVALQQVEWEKYASAARMQELNVGKQAMSKRLGVSPSTAATWAEKGRLLRRHRSPVENYLAVSMAVRLDDRLKDVLFTFEDNPVLLP